jgi:hypothetical protein
VAQDAREHRPQDAAPARPSGRPVRGVGSSPIFTPPAVQMSAPSAHQPRSMMLSMTPISVKARKVGPLSVMPAP